MSEHITTRYGEFDALLARHQRLIRSLCWWHAGGDTAKVRDMIQDVMMQLWHYRHSLRPDASDAEERQWVRLHCRSVFQHQRRKPTIETVPLEETHEVAANDHSSREVIERLATDLDDREQRLLEMMLDGYTNSEMAQTLHTSESEVSLMRKRIIEKMKNKANNINQ